MDTGLDNITINDIAEALPASTALVHFAKIWTCKFGADDPKPLWSGCTFVVAVVTNTEGPRCVVRELGDGDEIGSFVMAMREAIRGEGRQPVANVGVGDRADSGAALQRILFDKIMPDISTCTSLVIVPDAELNVLSFAMLPMADGGRLLDKFRISYVSSARELLKLGTCRPNVPTTRPLVYGDPDFDLRAGDDGGLGAPSIVARRGMPIDDLARGRMRFCKLPGAREEANEIASLYGVSAIVGRDVLEGTLKRQCRSPSMLHIATHGFVLYDPSFGPYDGDDLFDRRDELVIGLHLGDTLLANPMLRSALALAGANTFLEGNQPPAEAEDGLLTAEDVLGLDLDGTGLVVLSACDTGLGDVRVGEGVLGMRRAFVLAGAETLVMSLWKVPDEATRQLMIGFHRRLLRGMPRAEALRRAQLKLRRQYPKPYYWAAFVCEGDPGHGNTKLGREWSDGYAGSIDKAPLGPAQIDGCRGQVDERVKLLMTQLRRLDFDAQGSWEGQPPGSDVSAGVYVAFGARRDADDFRDVVSSLHQDARDAGGQSESATSNVIVETCAIACITEALRHCGTRSHLREWLSAIPSSSRHEHLAVAAYYLWEQEGQPHGRDAAHWFTAVDALRRSETP
jgi:hypothetical protein